MKWQANRQDPVLKGFLENGQPYDVYEEFGLYTIYVNGKMKSTHDSLDKAVGKLKYLNSIDRANHGLNMSPRQKPERRRNNV